jgi:hypothetical protein
MSNGFSNTAQRTNYSQNYRVWYQNILKKY